MVLYCGEHIISKSLTNSKKIKRILQNRIIFWDNYYANDYCPRRLFIGPYLGRQNINDVMINPTGLINTDLLILDIFANHLNGKKYTKDWENILKIHGKIKNFFKNKKIFFKTCFWFKPQN